jgi:purine-binding chemotaxis protein CheW
MNGIMEENVQTMAEEAQKKIDFKMVTFSLAGRDYGIDIMRVKEISKVNRFTYVPNTFPFVRGVHNLRGEIISVIDMRQMFNLSFQKKEKDQLENLLILGLSDVKIGVIVDIINKVVGISSETIQPPPPLFKDINIKYISGVVEHEDHLYIILDVEKIFEEETGEVAPGFEIETPAVPQAKETVTKRDKDSDKDVHFIADTLAAVRRFYVTDLNVRWVRRKLESWKTFRSQEGKSFQLADSDDADAFLIDFYSACTGMYFSSDLKKEFEKLLPQTYPGPIDVWDAGCGKGFESYSIAVILKAKYPNSRIKIWANDINLLDISSAPNIVPNTGDLPDYISSSRFFGETPKGPQFTQEIRDAVYFEYHDILNQNVVPEMDLVVARDTLSFLKAVDQEKVIQEFLAHMKPDAILVIGTNEELKITGFDRIESKSITAYRKSRDT